MRKTSRIALAVSAAVLLAPPVLAQAPGPGQGRGQFGGGPGGGQAFLLTQKSVQEELKLTEEQTKKATELAAKQQEARRGFRDLSQEEQQAKRKEMAAENQKALAEILQPDQSKRLKQ